MKVGIIGGTRGMGRLFAKLFYENGHDVSVAGKTTPIRPLSLVEKVDLVIVSVPIRMTIPVIEEITPFLRKDQIICDLTSLKVEPVEAMLRSDAQVIGLHPMFGPGVQSLKNQVIIVTPARCSDETLSFILNIFKSEGARITMTTPESHDKAMAIVQGLMHFSSLLIAETIHMMGVQPESLLKYASPVYRMEMGVVGRLLAQDGSLYGDILQMNPYFRQILENYNKAAEKVSKIILDSDFSGFNSLFELNKAFFGQFSESAMEETNHIIQILAER